MFIDHITIGQPVIVSEYNKINYPNCRSGYGVIPWSGSDKLSKKATQTEPKGNLSVVFSSYCIGSIPNAWLTVKGESTFASISCIVSGARLILPDLFFSIYGCMAIREIANLFTENVSFQTWSRLWKCYYNLFSGALVTLDPINRV